MRGFARFKNEEYTLYLVCVWARTLDQRRIYIPFSVCFGLKRFKNEEYTLHLACVWARTLDERRIYTAFSVCLGTHDSRTRNLHIIFITILHSACVWARTFYERGIIMHCISPFGLAHFMQFTNGIPIDRLLFHRYHWYQWYQSTSSF